MMSKDTDDIKLIKKAIRGNSTAYGYLIEKHRTYLYKMAFLYTKNEQDALDVVGDTILKGYLQIKTLKNAEKRVSVSDMDYTSADQHSS